MSTSRLGAARCQIGGNELVFISAETAIEDSTLRLLENSPLLLETLNTVLSLGIGKLPPGVIQRAEVLTKYIQTGTHPANVVDTSPCDAEADTTLCRLMTPVVVYDKHRSGSDRYEGFCRRDEIAGEARLHEVCFTRPTLASVILDFGLQAFSFDEDHLRWRNLEHSMGCSDPELIELIDRSGIRRRWPNPDRKVWALWGSPFHWLIDQEATTHLLAGLES